MKRIPVSTPMLGREERDLVDAALDNGDISGFKGEFISRFENEFASYSDCRYGVAVTSGTTALHLAMPLLGIGPGDEVLVSTYTNMATFFAVLYQGAKPIPIDVEPGTWNMDPANLEARITAKTKAVLVVHIFGHPADMDPILAVARKHKLSVIEDCAEAHGATYKGRKVGSLGDVGCYSFYANKIITTGEGGMLVTNDEALAKRANSLKCLAFGETDKFMHKELGYNYRMPNLQAAIGCAQMGKIDRIIEQKRAIAQAYTKLLGGLDCLMLPEERPYARNVYWMYHVVLKDNAPLKRDELMAELARKGIETRPGFVPYNMQKHFIEKGLTRAEDCPVANTLASSSLYLPSGPDLPDDDLRFVAETVCSALTTPKKVYAAR